MSESRFEGLMINRLLVLIQIVLIPIYFVVFSVQWREEITAFFDSLLESSIIAAILPQWLVDFEVYLGIPVFFSLPWVLFSIVRATRIADSYELMGRALGRVRIDQKLFYGLNAAFVLIFLILPFFSPIITIVGIMWAIRFILRKAIIGRIWIVWFIPALIVATIPILISIAFYSNYITLFELIFSTWESTIPVLFGIGLSMAIAIGIGNFVYFLNEGAVKYGDQKNIPHGLILVVKTALFGLLLLVYFTADYPNIPVFLNVASYIAVGLGFFEIVMRRVRDMPNERGTASGIVMVLAFSVVNTLIVILRDNPVFARWMQTIVIVLSALIFFALFWLSYSYAPEEFGYKVDKPKKDKKDRKSKDEVDDLEDESEDLVDDE